MDDASEDHNTWDHDQPGPLDDPEERQVLFAALDSYRQYRRQSHRTITHVRRQNLYALPQHQWKLLASPPFNLLDNLAQIDDYIDTNADIADAILDIGLQSLGIPQDASPTDPQFYHDKAKSSDHFKAFSTVRQFYRDWSAAGFEHEVKPVLDLVLADLSQHSLPPSTESTILLPGAGLGRLMFELALVGYQCTGNEISYHQLLASNFILNHTARANSYNLYPFLSTFTNNLSTSSQLSSVTIPDVHPSTAFATAASQGHPIGSMGMSAGDFITSYSTPDTQSAFAAVVTCYFVDTASNLIRYIQTIHHTLRPGGLWINIGPLLWHFDGRQQQQKHDTNSSTPHRSPPSQSSDPDPNPDRNPLNTPSTSNSTTTNTKPSPFPPKTSLHLQQDSGLAEPGSFELPYDLVLSLLEHSGFEVLVSQTDLDPDKYGRYITDADSMKVDLYRCGHWVVRKTV